MNIVQWSRVASLTLIALAGTLAPGCELRPSRDFAPRLSVHSGPPIRTFTGATDEGESDLEQPPPPAPPDLREPAHEEIVVHRLSNGMMLHALPRSDWPGATVLVVLGTKLTPSPSPTAQLYAQSALAGSSPWSIPHLEGATLFTIARPDFVAFGITALSAVIERAISRVLPGVVDAPLLGVHVDAARLMFAGGLAWNEPERLAEATALVGIFPMPHPYGWAGAALIPEWFRDIPVKSVTAFRDANLTTDNMTVVAAGDIDVTSLTETLERALAAVPHTPVAAPSPPKPAVACAGQVIVVDDAGSQQTTINQVYRGVPAAHADAAALQVLAAAAGGSISTHLNSSLRRRRGLTYGFTAAVRTMRDGGMFSLHGALEPARRVEGLHALDDELQALARTPLTDDALRAAKISAAHATSRLGGAALAVRLADAVVVGVPLSDTTALRAVTAEQVRAAAERYLQPTKRCLVVVGNAVRLERELRDAGFGTLSRAPR